MEELLEDKNKKQQRLRVGEKSEKLFWEVFRNVYLNSIIFNYIKYVNDSNNQFKFGVFKYYEINSTEWMIENGHLNLLRDKVLNCNNNNYLSFYCSDKNEMERDYIRKRYENSSQSGYNKYYKYSIFNVFKEDVEFFRSLIRNYPHYYQYPNTTNQDLERFSLEYDNLALMIILIEDYKYQPTIKLLERSIIIASINVSNYLYKTLILSSTTPTTLTTITTLTTTTTTTTSQPQPILQYLDYRRIWNIALNYIFISDFKILNKRVDLLINKYKLESPCSVISSNCSRRRLILNGFFIPSNRNSLNSFFRLFNIYIYQETIESIIECCKTVIYLKQLLEPIIEKLKLSKYNYSTKVVTGTTTTTTTTKEIIMDPLNGQSPLDYELANSYEWLSIEQINEIKESFNENQLKETLFGETNISDKRLMKLFNMLIIFTPPPQLGEDKLNKNYQFYRFKYFREFKEETKSLLLFNNCSDFGYFIHYDDKNYFQYNKTNHIYTIDDLQFKYCKNDFEIILQFINHSINDIIRIINNNNNNNIEIIEIIENVISTLICYCSKINNLEILKLIFNQLYPFYNKITLLPFNLYNSIESLDFIINFSNSIIDNNNNNFKNQTMEKIISNLFIYDNIELLYYVKENYQNDLIHFLKSKNKINLSKLISTFNKSKFYIECLNSFFLNFDDNNNYLSIKELSKNIFQGNIDYKDLRWLLNLTPKSHFLDEGLCNFFENKINNYKDFQLIHNLLLLGYNFTLSLENKVLIKSQYINHFNNQNQNQNNNENNNFLNSLIKNFNYDFILNELTFEIIKRNDIKLLIELIEMKEIKTIESNFKRIIINIISSGKIQLLEEIFSSNKILKETNKELVNQFLKLSFEKGNIEALLFLSKKFKISYLGSSYSSIKNLLFPKNHFKDNLFTNNNYYLKNIYNN
ncbi:hypothetical protein ACTA71_008102 [Dictyostelium dimigraforme]